MSEKIYDVSAEWSKRAFVDQAKYREMYKSSVSDPNAFWAEQVIALDAINPQVASRLARSMDRWRRYAPALQVNMKEALQQVASVKKLSNDVREVVSKALAN